MLTPNLLSLSCSSPVLARVEGYCVWPHHLISSLPPPTVPLPPTPLSPTPLTHATCAMLKATVAVHLISLPPTR
ncbi:hypothetical protein B484DRAFT_460292 [Ochromonadaceae sp. CCMP2298]|nr:hypothetical protein B484DRAFT_460292 [Ochromonadaceae sp. CCMP2298]